MAARPAPREYRAGCLASLRSAGRFAYDVGSVADPQPDASEAPPSSAIRYLQRVDRSVGLVEQAALCALLLLLVGAAAGQAIAARLFDTHWEWSHEIIQNSVFFIAMTGAALASQSERLISMDFVYRMMRPDLRAWLRQGLRLFTIAICILFAWGGMALREILANEPYVVLAKPTVALALPIGAGLIAFHQLLHGIIDLLYLTRGQLPPEAEDIPLH
jgi:TRAP-type C4-dicarboxylate transport system permease small subunit